MSEQTPSRFADAEQQIDQLQATLDHVKHVLQTADRAESAARGAAGRARRFARTGALVAALVVAGIVASKVAGHGSDS